MGLQMTPTFIGWKYPDGSIRITVEGSGDTSDDTTVFTYTPITGLEIGPSTVIQLDEPASIIVFKGSHDEQRKCYDAWKLLAEENNRPGIFRNEGMAALTNLDAAPMPPLPEIDEDATEHANEVLTVSRELMLEGAETRELTLEDCTALVAVVGDALEKCGSGIGSR